MLISADMTPFLLPLNQGVLFKAHTINTLISLGLTLASPMEIQEQPMNRGRA